MKTRVYIKASVIISLQIILYRYYGACTVSICAILSLGFLFLLRFMRAIRITSRIFPSFDIVAHIL